MYNYKNLIQEIKCNKIIKNLIQDENLVKLIIQFSIIID